jgi:hypothetical protein
LTSNFNLIKVREWKLKISYFFVISRGTTLSKSTDHNPIQTWPTHSYDVSTYAISTLYMHPNKSWTEETKNFFKRNNSVKKFIIPRPNLNLTYVILWCIHISNLNLMCATIAEIMNENWKFLFFSKFKRDNSVKNQHTITKFKLDLHIFMTNLHMQFQPYTCIQTKVRERKLKISIFFQSSRGITLSRINEP